MLHSFLVRPVFELHCRSTALISVGTLSLTSLSCCRFNSWASSIVVNLFKASTVKCSLKTTSDGMEIFFGWIFHFCRRYQAHWKCNWIVWYHENYLSGQSRSHCFGRKVLPSICTKSFAKGSLIAGSAWLLWKSCFFPPSSFFIWFEFCIIGHRVLAPTRSCDMFILNFEKFKVIIFGYKGFIALVYKIEDLIYYYFSLTGLIIIPVAATPFPTKGFNVFWGYPHTLYQEKAH